MAENPLNLPLQYVRCAKKGTFQEYGSAIKTMLKLIYGDFVSNFDAGENGAYYLYVENGLPDGVWFVCPDGSFDFDVLAAMDASAAIETVATYCETTPPLKWTEFAEWMSSQDSTLSLALSAVQSTTISGHTTNRVPAWTDPDGDISVFLRWVKQVVLNVETDNSTTLAMSAYRQQANQNKFVIPISCNAGSLGSFSLGVTLQI